MIVTICDSILFSIENNDEDAISFMDDLLSARRNGFIALDISKKQVIQLKSLVKFNDRQTSILDYEKEQATFKKDVLERFKYRAIFCSCKNCVVEHDISFDISNYQKNISFNGHNPISKPSIVFENGMDNNVYSFISSWKFLLMNTDSLLSSYHLSYHSEHGGGDTTGVFCEKLFDERFCVFSICDSDKKFPSDNFGDTSKKIKKAFSNRGRINDFLCVDAQEVENLVPLDIYYHYASGRPEQCVALDFIRECVNFKDESYIYYDFKKSYKLSYVVNCGDRYWYDIVSNTSMINLLKEYETSKIDCLLASKLSTLAKVVVESINSLPEEMNTSINISPLSLESQWHKISDFMLPRIIASKPYYF